MLEGDSNILGDLYKNCKDAKEKIRYAALYAVSRGKSVNVVAEIIDVEESTIYDWIKKWILDRSASDKQRSGRPPKITKDDEKEIHRLIDENNPKKYGINASSYTTKELQQYFMKFRGEFIDEETFRVHLITTGAHYVKAQFRYKEGNLKRQIEFAQNLLFLIQTGYFTKILFLDEMAVSISARNGYGWTYNQRLVVEAPQNGVEKANYFGVVEVTEGTIIETVRKSAKADSFLHLLHKIELRYPDDKMLIIIDNSQVHHCEKVSRFFNERDNMKPLFGPPYSPELNPEEYVHNFFRDKLLNNRNFKSIKQIRFVINRFVKSMTPETIRSITPLIPIEALLSAPKVL
jgi:transposase